MDYRVAMLTAGSIALPTYPSSKIIPIVVQSTTLYLPPGKGRPEILPAHGYGTGS